MARILLVDDDETVRVSMRLALEGLGHTVMEAADGVAAGAMQASDPCELLITDLIMPECDGVQIIREFRRLHPAVRIIAMSGGGRGEAMDYLKMARILGAAQVLQKPFALDALAAALGAVLRDASGMRDLR